MSRVCCTLWSGRRGGDGGQIALWNAEDRTTLRGRRLWSKCKGL